VLPDYATAKGHTGAWRLRRLDFHDPRDAAFLYALRREPVVAAAMFGPPPETLEDHQRWLAKVRMYLGTVLHIVQLKGPGAGWWDAGWLRFTVCPKEPGRPVDVSVALAPWARGRGLAAAVLAPACAALDAQRRSVTAGPWKGAGPLRARIKPENAASRASFARAGFREVLTTEEWVEMRYGD
jgi:RimJ/RimL family protein N-acetyltransferase